MKKKPKLERPCRGCKAAEGDYRLGGFCADCGRWSTVSIRARTRKLLDDLGCGRGWGALKPDEAIFQALLLYQKERAKR